MKKVVDTSPFLKWFLWGTTLFVIIQLSGVLVQFLPSPVSLLLLVLITCVASVFVGYKGTYALLPEIKKNQSQVNPILFGTMEAFLAGILGVVTHLILTGKFPGGAIPLLPLIFCTIGGYLAVKKIKK